MRISISITDYDGIDLPAVARAADEIGLDTLWVNDHLLQAAPGATTDGAMLEAYTTLGYLAASTTRVRLGAMVSPVTFREPALLIKAVTTLDHISGGRAWLGIGAGYNQSEATALGLPLPPVAERFGRLAETLQLAHAMWSGDERPFLGRYYRLDAPSCNPRPVRKPHPPVLIGGAGERHTLRLVAAHADACNLFDVPDGGETLRHKLAVLRRHCEDVGRDLDDLDVTVSTRPDPAKGADGLAEDCHRLADLGIDHLCLITNGCWTAERLHSLAPAITHAAREGGDRRG